MPMEMINTFVHLTMHDYVNICYTERRIGYYYAANRVKVSTFLQLESCALFRLLPIVSNST